jgi:hypothetical protein
MEIQARLHQLVLDSYGTSRKIHIACGQILHISSCDRHLISCRKESSTPESKIEDTRIPSGKRKRTRSSDSEPDSLHTYTLSSKKPKLNKTSSTTVYDEIENDLSFFISELHKNFNAWKEFLKIAQTILASYGMDFGCEDEGFIRNIALIALHFCKTDASYSEADLASDSPSFPKILKCILQQGHVELILKPVVQEHISCAIPRLCFCWINLKIFTSC